MMTTRAILAGGLGGCCLHINTIADRTEAVLEERGRCQRLQAQRFDCGDTSRWVRPLVSSLNQEVGTQILKHCIGCILQ